MHTRGSTPSINNGRATRKTFFTNLPKRSNLMIRKRNSSLVPTRPKTYGGARDGKVVSAHDRKWYDSVIYVTPGKPRG